MTLQEAFAAAGAFDKIRRSRWGAERAISIEDILSGVRINCMDAIAYDWEVVTTACPRIEFLENSLREIALFVSVGGYNNDEIPADIVDRIKDGIVALCATQRKTQTP